MSRRDLTALGASLLVGAACTVTAQPTPSAIDARYVALGDSYTVGTAVSPTDSWPSQLVARLDGRLELVANLGVNGYSTDDLIADELPALDDLDPGFVSVQIGVNDAVRGVPQSTYAANVEIILDALLERLTSARILAVATPDYTLTPAGSSFGDPAQQSAEIARFNEVLRSAAEARGIAFVADIYEISRRAAADPSLVAGDGLHPSGAQYALWVDAILPVVEGLLAES
ncbi:MAG: SGNH/GDSL hydrolase family protein [Candidatus Limnocylindria bacterium]